MFARSILNKVKPTACGIRGTSQFFLKNSRQSYRSYSKYYYFNDPGHGKPKQAFAWTPFIGFTVLASAAAISGVYFTHQEATPVTGRKRFMICPQWLEDKVGEMSYQQIMAQYGKFILPQDDPTSIQVIEIMHKLIDASTNYNDPSTGAKENLFENTKTKTVPKTNWKIQVIDDVSMGQETPNAFVIGDGKVFVFRSILPLCRNDDGLATVLSHELGHMLAHHIGEKISQSPLYLALAAGSYATTGSTYITNLLVQLCFERPASRQMESEADYIGLLVMGHACYDPHQAPEFWDRMIQFEKKSGGAPPEFISDHPSSEHRNENLKGWMPTAEKEYDLGGCPAVIAQAKGFANATKRYTR